MHLGWAFESAALRYPQMPGVVAGDQVLTYRDWFQRASAQAALLRRLGIQPGDRVMMTMRNREELATAYLAVQLAGAVSVPASFRFGAGELEFILRDCGASAVLYDDTTQKAVADMSGTSARCVDVAELAARAATDGSIGSPPNDESAVSVILYTSGTTGRPKGVPRTHRAEYAASAAHVIQCGYRIGERTLGAMPIAHTMGIRALLSMVLVNGLYVPLASVTEGSLLEVLRAHAVTSLYLVPTAFHIVLERLQEAGATLPHCRRIAYAGAPMTPSLVERCQAAFQPDVFVNHYGSTEVYTFTTSARQREKPGCAGRAGLHARIRLVEPTRERRVGPDAVVPAGEIGEVIVSAESDEAFSGYLNRPDATENAIRDGWYFTGDIGRLDEEGDLWIEGRVDDMIITGGENVYPIEVEDVISRHPMVAEVVVCGLPDERWGQVVTAFVVPRRDRRVEPQDIIDYARRDGVLAGYKRPRRVVMVKAIPKNPVGKILRRELLAGNYESLT